MKSSPSDPSLLALMPPIPLGIHEREAGRLPVPLTSFVGRKKETAEICDLLRLDDVRLVTLTGPGGVGKTRLALQVSLHLAGDFEDGPSFVPLAPISDPDLVLPTIAQTLGLRTTGDVLLESLVARRLSGSAHLLVLDNLEQVVDAAPIVSNLITACPQLKVLITSRISLHLSAEQEFPVPPLALPVPNRQLTVEEAQRNSAIALFVERARAVNPGFALNEDNAGTIGAICAQVDGLPLAIELAASRTKFLPPAALQSRLSNRLHLLAGSTRDVPTRLQTMRDAIAWSYDLLPLAEQVLFNRLAVFVGGFSLEAAESVGCRETLPGSHSAASVFDGVAALVDQSLLTREEGTSDEARFTMLETIREFGLEQLAASGEEGAVRDLHSAWCVEFAETALVGLSNPDQDQWLRRLDDDYANLRAAHAWLVDHQSPAALRLAAALWLYWLSRGYLDDGIGWLNQALAINDTGPLSATLAQALVASGSLAHYHGDDRKAVPLLERGLSYLRELDDPWGVVAALIQLGTIAADAGNYELADQHLNEALDLCYSARDHATPLLAAAFGGHPEIATGWVLYHRGTAAWGRGDPETAAADLERGLAEYRICGHRWGLSDTLGYLGLIACETGDVDRAAALLRETVEIRSSLGTTENLPTSLADIATLAAASGHAEDAARLFGASAVLRETFGTPSMLPERVTYERATEDARTSLGDAVFAREWAAGRTMSPEEAIALGLRTLNAATPEQVEETQKPASSDQAASIGLTVRELQVLKLLAEGRSNQEIAETLYISLLTAKTHVRNLLAKLELDSRAAATAYAHRNGLV